MNWSGLLDVIGALLLLCGAFLCFAAAVGVLRFPDVLSRMHAATKPQTLGLLLVVSGVAVSLRDPRALGVLLLVAVLQLITAPVSAHLVSRTAYRSNQVRDDLLATDDLARSLSDAGFQLVSDGGPDPKETPDPETTSPP